MALSDAKIRNAKPKAHRYRLADSHGLSLEISPSGNRFWRYRYRRPAIRACELLGKHIGMFVERRETVMRERMVVEAPEIAKDADEWVKQHTPTH